MKVLNWPCGQIRDIKKDNVEVSGTASQIMFLFESLPQLLHQTFSSHKQMWKLYNQLRSMTVVIFSNVIEKQTVEVLRDNIDKFLEYFKRAFNESTERTSYQNFTIYVITRLNIKLWTSY